MNMATAPQPASYTPTTGTAQTYDPSQWSVANSQTVQGQLGGILKQDSPLMQLAGTQAKQQMSGRGLLNSSMAVGAGQNAVIQNALPIAQQDAATRADAARTNTGWQNEAKQFNTGARNQFGLANMDARNQAGQFNANAKNQFGLTQLQGQIDINKLNEQQKNTLAQMAQGQQYTQANMGLQQNFDLAKMTQAQRDELARMAQAQGYNLQTMSQQQINQLAQMAQQQTYDLAKMGQQFGYDISKMNRDSVLTLERMAVEQRYDLSKLATMQGYDLEKMSAQQLNDLAKIATDYKYRADLMDKELANKYDIAKLDVESKMALMSAEAVHKDRLAASEGFRDQYRLYVDALYKIDADTSLNADAKAKLKNQMGQALNWYAKVEDLNLGIDFSKQFSTGSTTTKTSTSTAPAPAPAPAPFNGIYNEWA
jgi:hypothetical protein